VQQPDDEQASEEASAEDAQSTRDTDPDNSGIRREPELGDHEEVVPPPKAPGNEFGGGEDLDAAKGAARRRHLGRAMRRNARNASLDPDDGIGL
jgi:type IV secretion system protein VirD4